MWIGKRQLPILSKNNCFEIMPYYVSKMSCFLLVKMMMKT